MTTTRIVDVDLEREEARRERLRSAVPATVATAMLVGLLLAGALALQHLVGLGIWLIGSVGAP